jgi:hypothetical protein
MDVMFGQTMSLSVTHMDLIEQASIVITQRARGIMMHGVSPLKTMHSTMTKVLEGAHCLRGYQPCFYTHIRLGLVDVPADKTLQVGG